MERQTKFRKLKNGNDFCSLKFCKTHIHEYCEEENLDVDKLFQLSSVKTFRDFLKQFQDWLHNGNTDEMELAGKPYFTFVEYLQEDVSW